MSVGCDEGNFSFLEECSLLHISAGWHTQALARVICEIREIRVKFNHLCVKILVRLPCTFREICVRQNTDYLKETSCND